MAIVYCSWVNGHDDTGDGSYTNPYKTITTASTSRAAGDVVRVEKSPDPTALTGTTAWELNGTTVTGTGTNFTGELANGDFISAPDGNWYEVIDRPSATSATLYKKYPSANASGHSSQKLGVTDTGPAATSTTAIQTVSSSGTAVNYLYISGGWDLFAQEQTGQTWFRQIHTTFNNRYGYGLYFSIKNYVSIDKLNFLRYNYGIYISTNCNNNVITAATCNSNSYGIYISTNCNNNVITAATCNSNNNYGIYLYTGCNNNVITAATCNSNSNGIYYNNSSNNVITAATCNSNSNGIYYYSNSNNNIVYSLSTTGNTTAGIGFDKSVNICHNATIAEATKAAMGITHYADARQYINNLGGYSYIYGDYATVNSQNATAGGTGKEWKFSVTNAERGSKYPFYIPIARVAVGSTGKVTIKVYFKKSGTGIAGGLRCRVNQIAWSDGTSDKTVACPNDTNRNQVTLEFTPTEAGVVEIEAGAWYISATDQTVIIDDITISQA